MLRFLLPAALGAALPLAAAAHGPVQHDLPAPRPFEQMRGPCADFALDISREAAAWTTGATSLTAGTSPDGAPAVAPGQVVRLTLHAPGEVTFALPPEQERSAPDRFNGLATVTIPEAGLWRVAASNGLWFDAVVGGAIVPSGAFEMQTQCRAPFKVVVYDLPAGEVTLQLNGSPTAEVEILVLPWQ